MSSNEPVKNSRMNSQLLKIAFITAIIMAYLIISVVIETQGAKVKEGGKLV